MTRLSSYLLLTILLLCFQSCFSSFESTKKITESDVPRNVSTTQEYTLLDTITTPNFVHWSTGQRFIILDNQVNLILSPANSSLERGDTLYYDGYFVRNNLGIEETIVINFRDSQGNNLSYNTGKTVRECNVLKSFSIPFLLDENILSTAREQLVGKEYFIKTSYWNDCEGKNIKGKKYVKVKVNNVEYGNKIYSLKIAFDFAGKRAFLPVSIADNAVSNRRFSNMFTASDVKLKYPSISDEHWELITESQIQEGMNKEECRLAIGAPSNIERVPTYDHLQELWKYSDGVYLIFVDGILTRYRK